MLTPQKRPTLGDCGKFGHIFIVSGYGKSQYASQGRPMWINGKIPAQETAKSVMASANRLMEGATAVVTVGESRK